jgi:hypothetical protein
MGFLQNTDWLFRNISKSKILFLTQFYTWYTAHIQNITSKKWQYAVYKHLLNMFQYLALLISSTFSYLSIHNPFPISVKYRSTVRSAHVGITSQDMLTTITHFSYVSWLKPSSDRAFDRYCITSLLSFSNVTDQNKSTRTQVHKHPLKNADDHTGKENLLTHIIHN